MKIRSLGRNLAKNGLFISLLALSLAALAPGARAAGGAGDYYLGGETGFAILNAGAGAHPDFGLSFMGRLTLPVLIGGFYSYIPYGSVTSTNGTSVSGSEKFYGGQIVYDFTPLVTGLMAGARFGFSSVSTQSYTTANGEFDDSNTGLAWGPLISYDHMISSAFSFGGEMIIMLPSETAAPNVFQLLATLKWWF